MRIYRYEVPVDDQFHTIKCGTIVKVDTRSASVVEIWALEDREISREYIVVGTGHAFDAVLKHVGTAVVPGGIPGSGLVWHLLQRDVEADQ